MKNTVDTRNCLTKVLVMTLRDAVLVKKKKDLSSFLLDSVVDSMQLDHNKEICQLLLVL